ncbi:MAG: Ig-like domain-containing protein [Crocinitomicaceae bacterium]|nr:Ig-like domain-containing protein [Crocinitomicaceae bacterium]
MARYSYLIFFASFILASCAQVGSITGGEKDTSAPKPIPEKVDPPNASVNFSGNKVVIPFDEYFTLSSPSTSIQIVPPHATIKATAKKKTLTLEWEEELQPNTTYAIYLNNTVKDLSEKNDSIMQYVFSTGSSLDSTNFSVPVVDAYTNAPITESVVALYDQNTNTLVNFAQTNRSGNAILTYLRPGTYKIIAFKDENNDLLAQEGETVGFLEDSLITIDSTGFLATPIRMFDPVPEPEVSSAKFVAPATFVIETNTEIENPIVSIDGNPIDSSQYYFEEETKLLVFIDPAELSSGKISLATNSFADTTSYRLLDSKKEGLIRITPMQKANSFAPSQAFSFKVNDVIQSIDTSLIKLTRAEDSAAVSFNVDFSKNVLSFDIPRGASQEIRVEFQKDAITTVTGNSSPFIGLMKLNSPKKYGILSLDVSSYTNTFILQVFKGQEMVREQSLEPTSERVLISELTPGDYSFKIVRDENQNGKWDTGDLKSRTLPEQIDQYSQTTKVRANWEVEVELVPIDLKE